MKLQFFLPLIDHSVTFSFCFLQYLAEYCIKLNALTVITYQYLFGHPTVSYHWALLLFKCTLQPEASACILIVSHESKLKN
jgi:hypothetical protein